VEKQKKIRLLRRRVPIFAETDLMRKSRACAVMKRFPRLCRRYGPAAGTMTASLGSAACAHSSPAKVLPKSSIFLYTENLNCSFPGLDNAPAPVAVLNPLAGESAEMRLTCSPA
jgi:hypothetical protein